jgi:hypothetical protein
MLGKDETMPLTQRNDVRLRMRLWAATAVVLLGALTLAAPSGAASADDGRDQASVGYVLERGRARIVAFPGATSTVTAGINDRGVIVGKYKDADGRDHGFLRNRWGRYVRIDVHGAGGTEAYKVNDRGQVVGSYNPQGPLAGDPGSKGFLFDRGRFITIEMPGAVYTQALGINDAGVVVGEYLDNDGNFHGFRWHRGRMEIIEVPGSTGTSVSDINDHGDLVGVHGDLTGGIRGFVLRNRPQARFESFNAPGARYTLVLGVNDRRQIVGAGGNELVNSAAEGFLLTGGANGAFTPIEIRGTTNTVGTDINNRRQIVAGIFPPDQQADTAQPLDMTAGMAPPPDSLGDAGRLNGRQAAPREAETTATIRGV